MKRSPLRRGGPLKRRTPLRQMSRKRSKQQRLRRVMVQEELGKRELCEAGVIIRQWRLATYGQEYANRLNVYAHRCNGLAIELHEPLTRARGGSILDPANTVAICRPCHDWVHAHPTAATAVGLLQSTHGGPVPG